MWTHLRRGWEIIQTCLWRSSKVFSMQETDPRDSSAFAVKKCCRFSSPSCRAHGDVAGF